MLGAIGMGAALVRTSISRSSNASKAIAASRKKRLWMFSPVLALTAQYSAFSSLAASMALVSARR
jgi:hypothetical protein